MHKIQAELAGCRERRLSIYRKCGLHVHNDYTFCSIRLKTVKRHAQNAVGGQVIHLPCSFAAIRTEVM